MNESGITINEACAKRAAAGSGFLTDEDFANQCNPDGTVKQSNQSTVINMDATLSGSSTSLYLGAVFIILVVVVLIWYLIKRKNPKQVK